MNFGEAIPIPLDTADESKVGQDDLTPPPCKIGLMVQLISSTDIGSQFLNKITILYNKGQSYLKNVQFPY